MERRSRHLILNGLKLSTWQNIKEKATRVLGILKAFSLTLPSVVQLKLDVEAVPGTADSGDFQQDLTEIMLEIGELSREAHCPICFLLDETQYLKQKEFGALIAAAHRVSQKSLPIVIICAGLPQIAALFGDAKSYAERLFEFVPIRNLQGNSAAKALTGPAQQRAVSYTPAAVQKLLNITEGYPYFIQEYGKTFLG